MTGREISVLFAHSNNSPFYVSAHVMCTLKRNSQLPPGVQSKACKKIKSRNSKSGFSKADRSCRWYSPWFSTQSTLAQYLLFEINSNSYFYCLLTGGDSVALIISYAKVTFEWILLNFVGACIFLYIKEIKVIIWVRYVL